MRWAAAIPVLVGSWPDGRVQYPHYPGRHVLTLAGPQRCRSSCLRTLKVEFRTRERLDVQFRSLGLCFPR